MVLRRGKDFTKTGEYRPERLGLGVIGLEKRLHKFRFYERFFPVLKRLRFFLGGHSPG
jgi:hypothetical protein